jgi:peptide subunit release factor 1 (eRF1)
MDHPYVQPLQEALDEYEELLVAVVGPIQTRLLSSFLGFTTEELTVINPSEEQFDDYLPRVAEAIGRLADDHKIGRIMLAGNHGINTELLFLLPKDLRRRVVGFLSLPANATQKQLEDAVRSARCRVEREQESAKILRLFNRACMAVGAVTGPAATLEALNEGRIEELEYAEGVSILGSHCETCNFLYVAQAICPRCQSAVRPVEDLIDLIILRALQKGATVEQVRNEAADNLRAAGGIGAFVKR